jgi:large subunit ribosomal protein L40
MLKPVEEIEGDRTVLKTLDKRKRDTRVLSFDESERRAALIKDWSRYKYHQYIAENRTITRIRESQQHALDELRKESEELYQQAVQVDDQLIPFVHRGPVETPPIKGYVAADGEYINTTRKFDK